MFQKNSISALGFYCTRVCFFFKQVYETCSSVLGTLGSQRLVQNQTLRALTLCRRGMCGSVMLVLVRFFFGEGVEKQFFSWKTFISNFNLSRFSVVGKAGNTFCVHSVACLTRGCFLKYKLHFRNSEFIFHFRSNFRFSFSYNQCTFRTIWEEFDREIPILANSHFTVRE